MSPGTFPNAPIVCMYIFTCLRKVLINEWCRHTPQPVPTYYLFPKLSFEQSMNRLILDVRLYFDYESAASRNLHNWHMLHTRNAISRQTCEDRDTNF